MKIFKRLLESADPLINAQAELIKSVEKGVHYYGGAGWQEYRPMVFNRIHTRNNGLHVEFRFIDDRFPTHAEMHLSRVGAGQTRRPKDTFDPRTQGYE